MLVVMCGDSQSANSAASTITPGSRLRRCRRQAAVKARTGTGCYRLPPQSQMNGRGASVRVMRRLRRERRPRGTSHRPAATAARPSSRASCTIPCTRHTQKTPSMIGRGLLTCKLGSGGGI